MSTRLSSSWQTHSTSSHCCSRQVMQTLLLGDEKALGEGGNEAHLDEEPGHCLQGSQARYPALKAQVLREKAAAVKRGYAEHQGPIGQEGVSLCGAQDVVGHHEGGDGGEIPHNRAARFIAVAGERGQEPGAEPLAKAAALAQHAALDHLRTVEKTVGDFAQTLGTQLCGELAIGADRLLVVLRLRIPLEASLVAESKYATPVDLGEIHTTNSGPMYVT